MAAVLAGEDESPAGNKGYGIIVLLGLLKNCVVNLDVNACVNVIQVRTLLVSGEVGS